MSAIQCFDGSIFYSNTNVHIQRCAPRRCSGRRSIEFSKQCNILSFRIFVSDVQKDKDCVPKLIIPVPNGTSLKMQKTPKHKKNVVTTSWELVEHFSTIPKEYSDYVSHLPTTEGFGCIVLYPKVGIHIYDRISYIHDIHTDDANKFVYVPITYRKQNEKIEKQWYFNNRIHVSLGKSFGKKTKIYKLFQGLCPNKDLFIKI